LLHRRGLKTPAYRIRGGSAGSDPRNEPM